MHFVLRIRWMLLIAAVLAPMATARADQLDIDLAEQGRRLVKEIDKRGYKNIGVLSFQIKRHEGPINMHVGTLNSMLARRLENLLVLQMMYYFDDDERPGLVRDAGTAAVKNARERKDKTDPTYLDEDGRKRLFMGTYPLAWGDKQVPVDAFLTGLVHFSCDMTKARVYLKVIERKNPKELQDLWYFDTETTLNTLGDMGLDFAARPLRVGNDPPKDKKQSAVAVAVDNISKPILTGLLPPVPPAESPKNPPVVVPKNPVVLAAWPPPVLEGRLKFDVYYDHQPQDLSKDASPPKEGQSVHFEVENVSPETLGLVLRVNGINTVDNDDGSKDRNKFARWVLAPKTRYGIYGFYTRLQPTKKDKPNAKCEKFRAGNLKRLQENPQLAVPDKLGEIELDIFVAGKEEVRTAELRSLSAPLPGAKTFKELFGRVHATEQRALKQPVGGNRSPILPDQNPAEELNLDLQEFTGTLDAHATIRYYAPPSHSTQRNPHN